VEHFRSVAAAYPELLARLRAFRAQPGAATWPFAAVSLHVDGLALDPSSHHLRVVVETDAGAPQELYAGGVRLPPSLEGEFVMSFPLPAFPRRVRLEVGGFAWLGLTRVRVETLAGTSLPARVVEHGGLCLHPEHLLSFDRKLAVFNSADIRREWLSLVPPPVNYVVLEFAPPAACPATPQRPS